MLTDSPPASAPDPAFRRHDSGLFVPADISREREVWTKADSKILDRALALLQSRHLTVLMRCDEPKCRGSKLERIKGVGTEYTLRCPHKDRIFTRAF